MEGLSHEGAMKSLAMATFHDLAEARTGDLDFVAKHYGVIDEEKAVSDQLDGLEFSEDLHKLIEEYEKRTALPRMGFNVTGK